VAKDIEPMQKIIALVEDDQNLLTSLAMILKEEGFAVRSYANGMDALAGLATYPADLAVLDVKMPRMDGIELLRHIRTNSTLPVIFLTSSDDEADVVAGFRTGADDYLTKPFSQRILIERIRALLRRREIASDFDAEPIIERGGLVINVARHECIWMGCSLDLTATEFLLLKCLVLRPGQIKNRRQLMEAAFGSHIFVDERTIDSHLKRLRQKFKALDPDFARIQTVYGLGYRFTEK
jgi:two-component system response regulator ChvI